MRGWLTRPLIGKKRVSWRRRLAFWGCFFGLLVGFYYWQPQRYEFFPPAAPELKRVSPEEVGLLTPGVRVLVITAHPDDSEFFIGGTLLRIASTGAKIRLVVMTDGDKAYYPFGVDPSLTQTRRTEERRAAAKWNGEVFFLGYRDGRLPVNEQTVGDIVSQLRQFQPDIVIAQDPVYRQRISHSDHIDAGRNALRALDLWGGHCWVALMDTRAPSCFIDIDKQWLGKVDLLKTHASQFHGERLELVTGFLAERAMEEGNRAGLGMAESFRAYRR